MSYVVEDGVFSFEYKNYNINCRYYVEFKYKEPDFSTWDSDWDYNGGFEEFEVERFASSCMVEDCTGSVSLVYFMNLPQIVKDKFTEELRNHALRTVKEKYRIP